MRLLRPYYLCGHCQHGTFPRDGLVRLLGSREGDHFASVDTGLQGYKARHNLAVLYQEQGRPAKAEAQWHAALAECPGFLPARVGLGELYLAQQRWAELDAVLEDLEVGTAGAPDVALLRARAHLTRQEFEEARRVLEGSVARAPGQLRKQQRPDGARACGGRLSPTR